MTRMSIDQFRAALADPADDGAAMRAYRRLARHADAARAIVDHDWPTWPPVAASTGRAPAKRLPEWAAWPPVAATT